MHGVHNARHPLTHSLYWQPTPYVRFLGGGAGAEEK